MNRFYTLVTTQKLADGQYGILLDGKPVKTKGRIDLSAPSEAIANGVMQEWAAQSDKIIPDTMPMTQILNTKIDRISVERDVITGSVLKYLDTDLVCYYAEKPSDLVEDQKGAWKKWQSYFEKKFDCILQTTDGLAALTQEDKAHSVLKGYVDGLDDDHFTVLQLVTSLSGSIILAACFVDGGARAADVFTACFVEENFKNALYDAEKYGVDPLLEKQQKEMTRDLNACQNYLMNL